MPVELKGPGATSVAPGKPVPGTSGAGATASGAIRLRVCANPGAGGRVIIPTTAKAAAQRRNTMGPHPDIRFFVDPKDGIFKPFAAGTGRRSVSDTLDIELTWRHFHHIVRVSLWPVLPRRRMPPGPAARSRKGA
jgi:hypothetical protein